MLQLEGHLLLFWKITNLSKIEMMKYEWTTRTSTIILKEHKSITNYEDESMNQQQGRLLLWWSAWQRGGVIVGSNQCLINIWSMSWGGERVEQWEGFGGEGSPSFDAFGGRGGEKWMLGRGGGILSFKAKAGQWTSALRLVKSAWSTWYLSRQLQLVAEKVFGHVNTSENKVKGGRLLSHAP